MRYRVTMSIEVEAQSDAEAYQFAEKLAGLLKSPLVRMAVMDEGIRLAGDGHPVVHMPQREASVG
jgi:hypothetical protein